MEEKYYTVEQIADMLSIHPKTIQRYIREGKLLAGKIGKSWRITGHDLSVFIESMKDMDSLAGGSSKSPIKDKIRISSVVDISVHNMDNVLRIVNTLTAVINSKPPEYGNSSMHTQYIQEENKLRLTLWGGISFMEVILDAVSTLTQQIEE